MTKITFNKIISTIQLILLIMFTTVCYGQQELSSFVIDNNSYNKQFNPAKANNDKIEISMLNFYNSLDMQGPTLSELNTSSKKDVWRVNPSRITRSLLDKNLINFSSCLQTINVGFGIKGLEFDIGHSFRQQAHIVYPKDLIALLINGNAGHIGSSMNLAVQSEVQSFHQFNLGIAGAIKNLRLGANFKLLFGAYSLSTEYEQLDLHTSDDIYQLDLMADYTIHSAGLFTIDQQDSIIIDFNGFNSKKLPTDNQGFALDFGMIYKISDKWQVSASMVDLGFINWTKNTENYSLKKQISFAGLELDQIINRGDSISFSDTLKTLIDFDRDNKEFKTKLSSSLYFSVDYMVTDKLTLTGLFYKQFNRHFDSYSIAVNGYYKFNENFCLGSILSLRDGKDFNFGVNSTMIVSPFRLYVAADNIMALVRIGNARHLNFKVGTSWSF